MHIIVLFYLNNMFLIPLKLFNQPLFTLSLNGFCSVLFDVSFDNSFSSSSSEACPISSEPDTSSGGVVASTKSSVLFSDNSSLSETLALAPLSFRPSTYMYHKILCHYHCEWHCTMGYSIFKLYTPPPTDDKIDLSSINPWTCILEFYMFFIYPLDKE